ncbi:replication initiator [Herbidospora cretacea]|uniref:replication initiator n=1 Tax=Herbidospora cretacea TaxID=28444 RepID=UPI0007745A86|nr:replication initiator [Herbidospora cretacea]
MPQNTNAHLIAGIIARLDDPSFDRWASQIRGTGGCRQPIRLRGHVEHIDQATGGVLHRYTTRTELGGVLNVPCKTRRATRCPACAEIYRADTYQLVRAGLVGGKGVPASVITHPSLLVTLTAPSFGIVHNRGAKKTKTPRCRVRRAAPNCTHGVKMTCPAKHSVNDTRLGEPFCFDCYGYTEAVLFNALAPELWRRFTEALRRRVAKLSGLSNKELRQVLTISFAKVAEYQHRGVVHFHAVVRPDGTDGPASPPPAWATVALLTDAIHHAAGVVSVTVPAIDDLPERTLTWGKQLDIRPITLTGDLTDQAVAGYIAKYATKSAESTGTLDRRIQPLENLAALPISEHARRHIAECFRLATLDDLADLKLDRWAHMLGFRGHFSTKSRRYSTTLGALRAAREEHRRGEAITTGRLPLFPEDAVAVIGDWSYAGKGLSLAEQALTRAIVGGAL